MLGCRIHGRLRHDLDSRVFKQMGFTGIRTHQQELTMFLKEVVGSPRKAKTHGASKEFLGLLAKCHLFSETVK